MEVRHIAQDGMVVLYYHVRHTNHGNDMVISDTMGYDIYTI